MQMRMILRLERWPVAQDDESPRTITDPVAIDAMKAYRAIALQPDAIGRAVRYALEQPEDADINEIVIRPTKAPH